MRETHAHLHEVRVRCDEHASGNVSIEIKICKKVLGMRTARTQVEGPALELISSIVHADAEHDARERRGGLALEGTASIELGRSTKGRVAITIMEQIGHVAYMSQCCCWAVSGMLPFLSTSVRKRLVNRAICRHARQKHRRGVRTDHDRQ